MKRRTKILVLFLILVITFPGEVAQAFSFIPKFIAHYHHHNEAHHEVGIVQFVAEHFNGEDEHYKSEHHDEERENCPFSHHHTTVQLVYIFKKEPNLILVKQEDVPDLEKSTLPDYRFTFSEYNGSIWQPPKISLTV